MRTSRAALLAFGLLTFCSGESLGAQEVRTIRGQILSAGSGTPVGGAAVAQVGGEGRQVTVSDASGAFVLQTSAGPVRLVAAALGFAPDTLAIAGEESSATFRLRATPLALDSLVVTARRSFSAASSQAIRDIDIQLRPRDSSQDLLSLVPGLVIAQHGGGGKAEQIFLRGFDVDHGTDVAISVDGTPVNMVSHAHGQGYSDLHFLIPEVVERAEVRKGPYEARDGDFATAGAVSFRTRDRLPHGVAAVRGGSFATGQALAMVPFGGDASRPGGYLAVAGHTARGPFDIPQAHRRLNLFGKWTAPLSRHAELVASLSGFSARWNQTGQVPERAVADGTIGRFGAIDPSEGGDTERYDVSLGVRSSAAEAAQWEARVYAGRYRFQLFSNFTFFLNDSIDGDGIEQTDDRYLGGFHAKYAHTSPLLGRTAQWSMGIGGRVDRADIALHHQRDRQRLDTWVDDDVSQGHLFTWGQYEIAISERARLQLGLRSDGFRFAVDDRLLGEPSDLPRGSGTKWRGIVSPKANLAVDLTPSTGLFVNLGSGFHSNHARDVVLAGRGERVLPRAIGAEVGSRHTREGGSVAVAAWALDLESELVYVGDEGITEPSGRTRRLGVDLEARVRLLRWLWADADLTLSRSRLRDEPRGADRVALAPTATSAGGLTVRDLGPAGGGLRYRHIGTRAADETASVLARGYTLWEVFGRWRIADVEFFATLDNLLNVEWNEAQFATTSRLRGEPDGVTELHFTPGSPRRVQLGLEYQF